MAALTKRVRAILELLMRRGELTGLEIRAASRGLGQTRLVYLALYAMEEDGLIASRRVDGRADDDATALSPPVQRLYWITGRGRRAVDDHAEGRQLTGIAVDGAAYARCITRDQDWGTVTVVVNWGRTVLDDDGIN